MALALEALIDAGTGSTGYSASVVGGVLTVSHATAATLIGSVTQTKAFVTASIDAATRSLTLTARNDNETFAVSGVSVLDVVATPAAPAVDAAVSTPTAAGSNATQVATVVVPGGSNAPVADVEYSVTLNGVKHLVKVGQTNNSNQVIVNTWASVLAALEMKLEATSLVDVTFNDQTQTLTLTATQANTAFTVSAGKIDTGVGTPSNPLAVPGDYVLIIPTAIRAASAWPPMTA